MNDKLNIKLCGIQSCIFKAESVDELVAANSDSGERCINCILDALLKINDNKLRNSWINLLKKGYLEINCSRTRTNYRLLPEFFNNSFSR